MATRIFVIVGNKAVTSPFSLNDLAGAAGRMDLLCRALSAAFFVSHGMRRDVRAYIVLRGEPCPPRCISFDGKDLKYMSPDERNIAGLIRKALGQEVKDRNWVDSTPGIRISVMDLPDLLGRIAPVPKRNSFYLVEDGDPVEEAQVPENPVFLLGDHNGLTEEQEALLGDWTRLSLGERSYHTDHCITVVNHVLDKRGH